MIRKMKEVGVEGALLPTRAKRVPPLTRAMRGLGATALAVLALGAAGASAQEAEAVAQAVSHVSDESQFVFNTFSFLVTGFLVMFMAAGFCMLEVGLVRSKNAAAQCIKNVGLYSISGLMFYLVGYNVMYSGVDGGLLGTFSVFGIDDSASIAADGSFFAQGAGYAAGSDWFFQMVFCATASSIVSGTVAERTKVWPFLIFSAILTAVIYPVIGAWTWGGGWLSEIGFSDFAGSTIVHSTGGWAALVGALVIGARSGKFGPGGAINPMPGSSLPLAALGTFVLWLGWFGFNGGSQLALGSAADAAAISTIFINTNNAAAAGCVTAMIVTQLVYKKLDLTMALNGALAGLVSITAEPLAPSIGVACLIGAVGGALVVLFVPLIDRLRVDDVVGAIPVHLVGGIWGTLAVPISNTDASVVTQAIGVVAVGAFVSTISLVVWLALKFTVGVRATDEEEYAGLDTTELGLEAYPEFGRG